MQAAGRIHRLGQTKDVFIRRYVFRDSIEAATDALHGKIKSGEIKVRDGRFPPEAHALFKAFGPSASLFKQRGDDHGKSLRGEGILDWQGAPKRPLPKKGEPPIKLKPSWWTRRATEECCTLCGVRRLKHGSSQWDGSGIFSYLKAGQCDGVDPPPPGEGVGHFWAVPSPPDNWMPERFGKQGPIALLNLRSARDAKQEELDRLASQNGGGGGGSGGGSGGLGGLPFGGGRGGGGGASSSSHGGAGPSGAGASANDDDEGEGEGEEEEGEEADPDFVALTSTGKTVKTSADRDQIVDCSEGETDELEDESLMSPKEEADLKKQYLGFGGNFVDRMLDQQRFPWLEMGGQSWYQRRGTLQIADREVLFQEFTEDYPEVVDEVHGDFVDYGDFKELSTTRAAQRAAEAAVAEEARQREADDEESEYEDAEQEAAAYAYQRFLNEVEVEEEPDGPMGGDGGEFYHSDDEEGGGGSRA